MSRKINIRSPMAEAVFGPLNREIIRAEEKVRNKFKWVYWHWKPLPLTANQKGSDCGYSGLREDCEGYSEMLSRLSAWLPKNKEVSK